MESLMPVEVLFATEDMVKLEGETLSLAAVEARKFNDMLICENVGESLSSQDFSADVIALYNDVLSALSLSYSGEFLSPKQKRNLKQVIRYIKEYGRRFIIMVRKWIDKASIYVRSMDGIRRELLKAVEENKFKKEITIPDSTLNKIQEFLFDKTNYGYGTSFMTFDKNAFDTMAMAFTTIEQLEAYMRQYKFSYPAQEFSAWVKRVKDIRFTKITFDIGETVRGSSPLLLRCYDMDGLIRDTLMMRVRLNLVVLKYLPNTKLSISDAWLDKSKLELELKQTKKSRLKLIDAVYNRITDVFKAHEEEYYDEESFHKDAIARSKFYYVLMTDVNRRFKDAINLAKLITDYK